MKHGYFWCLILVSILFGSSCDGQQSFRKFINQTPTKNAVSISSKGDAIIAGLLPAHHTYDQHNDKCNKVDDQGIYLILAMVYAITQANNNQHLLPGIILGYNIRDTCHNKLHIAKEALKLMFHLLPLEDGPYGEYYTSMTNVGKPNNGSRRDFTPLIGLIGTTTYDSTIATASILGEIKMSFICIRFAICKSRKLFEPYTKNIFHCSFFHPPSLILSNKI